MGITVSEAAEMLDPAMTMPQVRALIVLAGIQPSGRRRDGRVGYPPHEYDEAAIRAAHAGEAARTLKQFADNDWIASALLARNLIRADIQRGFLWWPDGTRAETLRHDFYGEVRIGPQAVGAHRIIWIVAEGEIPPAMQVNHRNRLKWDNRRANLELVSFGNNIRHAHGTPYRTYHQAIHELTQLPAAGPEVQPWAGLTRTGGVFRVGTGRRRGGN
jgi:HNH endonuclease